MEFGLELRTVLFRQSARYVVAVIVVDDAQKRAAFISEPSSPSCSPEWSFPGVCVASGAGGCGVTLSFWRDAPPAGGPRGLIEVPPLCSCSFPLSRAEVGGARSGRELRSFPLLVRAEVGDSVRGGRALG
ncbi:unnamed protein product [Prorocentrum cordatum]|uniref:Uncharacterized protein n=1 Tax=Prorocentrum cordatum TaxID=2364126 RepID=A0ABN9RZ95_9DINO|nr:unnamed protein product [Polarella glacialis]